uniref:NAD(P)-binding protein n=1 Tax=Mycena chlorophos TaxID=658473 RepID=A0ABQ0KXE3_MYCCL|nr:NAD(P)-binding protein [Mycena chlorophos]
MAPRVWFITGASSGFGFIMATKALANGDKVVATLRKPEFLNEFAAQYTKDQLLVLKLDVTKLEDIKAGFAAAKETFGRIDVVLNNSGFGIIHEVESASEENARRMFEVNFWGAARVTQQAVAFFRDVNSPQGGLLMNMSPMFGVDASPGAGFYCASKFAGEALTDALVKELDPAWNIKVMILCPGWFKTNMTTVNAVLEEQHPAYAKNPNLASSLVRGAFVALERGDSPLLQDPNKLIEKIWTLSTLENPPYRVAFGEDAKACFEACWKNHKRDLEASEEWSKGLTFSH